MSRSYCILFLLLLSRFVVVGQESQFSQYFSSGTMLNPAYAGVIPNPMVGLNYKTEGNLNSDDYVNLFHTSLIYPIIKVTSSNFQTGGIGLDVIKESRGFQSYFTIQKILLTGAYTFRISKFKNKQYENTLTFALQGGIVQHQFRGDKYTWGSQFSRYIGYDPSKPKEPFPSLLNSYKVINFGAIFSIHDNEHVDIRDKSMIFGFSVENLNEPAVEFAEVGSKIQLKRKYSVFFSSKISLRNLFSLNPSGYLLVNNRDQQVNIGMSLSKRIRGSVNHSVSLLAGTWYRFEDAVIFLLGVDYNDLKLAMSMDFNTSTFNVPQEINQFNSSVEISVQYNFRLRKSDHNISTPVY